MLPLTAFIHRKFVVLNQNTPIFQASRAICDNQIGCLLVGDDEGSALGIVTDRDLVCRGLSEGKAQDTSIKEIMSAHPVTENEEGSLVDVIELMERHGIRRIPIIHKNPDGKSRFSGIVTLDDLVAANQIEASQLSRIVRRQIGRRMAYLTSTDKPSPQRLQARSTAHKKETLHRFYSHLSKDLHLQPDVLPGVIHFILGSLITRVNFTSASHFLAQLPQWIQEPLLRLPAGPDRKISADYLIHELCSRFHFTEEQARATFSRILLGLNHWMGEDSLNKLRAQLPHDFYPYFESATQENLKDVPESSEIEKSSALSSSPPTHQTAGHSSDPIAWDSTVTFADRTQAAELLAERLSIYHGKHPLVLAIPRGSVGMAKIVAEKLEGDLDVVLVHKIGAPDNPEFAIGSVSEFGTIYYSGAIEYYEVSRNYLDKTARQEIARLKQRRELYSPIRPPISPENRIVIIVDDGIATGSTMLAAIRAIRSQKPQKIVVAAPVASPGAIDILGSEADQMVILEVPKEFLSIGQFYASFRQLSDEEVLRILSEAEEKAKPHRHATVKGKPAA